MQHVFDADGCKTPNCKHKHIADMLAKHVETKDAAGRKVCRFYDTLGKDQCWKGAE